MVGVYYIYPSPDIVYTRSQVHWEFLRMISISQLFVHFNQPTLSLCENMISHVFYVVVILVKWLVTFVTIFLRLLPLCHKFVTQY